MVHRLAAAAADRLLDRLFFLAAAGQSRLNTANERVHDSQLRSKP